VARYPRNRCSLKADVVRTSDTDLSPTTADHPHDLLVHVAVALLCYLLFAGTLDRLRAAWGYIALLLFAQGAFFGSFHYLWGTRRLLRFLGFISALSLCFLFCIPSAGCVLRGQSIRPVSLGWCAARIIFKCVCSEYDINAVLARPPADTMPFFASGNAHAGRKIFSLSSSALVQPLGEEGSPRGGASPRAGRKADSRRARPIGLRQSVSLGLQPFVHCG